MLKGVFQYNIGVIRLGDIGCNRCIVEADCKVSSQKLAHN